MFLVWLAPLSIMAQSLDKTRSLPERIGDALKMCFSLWLIGYLAYATVSFLLGA